MAVEPFRRTAPGMVSGLKRQDPRNDAVTDFGCRAEVLDVEIKGKFLVEAHVKFFNERRMDDEAAAVERLDFRHRGDRPSDRPGIPASVAVALGDLAEKNLMPERKRPAARTANRPVKRIRRQTFKKGIERLADLEVFMAEDEPSRLRVIIAVEEIIVALWDRLIIRSVVNRMQADARLVTESPEELVV